MMDSKQINRVSGSLLFVIDGLIGLIYYLTVFYSIGFVIFSLIITIMGIIFLLLSFIKKLPIFGFEPLSGSFQLLEGWFIGIIGVLAYLLEPAFRHYFFLLPAYGLSAAIFGTYLYITRHSGT